MRVVRWSGLPAVVRIRDRGHITVAVPRNLSRQEVLDLAGLVLSGTEYQEFCQKMINWKVPQPR